MELSIKGIIITSFIVSIFMLALTNFIVLFPEQEGKADILTSSNASALQLNSEAIAAQTTAFQSNSESTLNKLSLTTYLGGDEQKGFSKSSSTWFSNAISGIRMLASQVFGIENDFVIWTALISFVIAISAFLMWQFIKSGR